MASCEWVGTPGLTDVGNREAVRVVGSVTSVAALGLQWVKSAIQSRNIKGAEQGGVRGGRRGKGRTFGTRMAGRRGSSSPSSILLDSFSEASLF